MGMRVTMDTRGLDALIRNIRPQASQIVRKTALDILSEAQSRAPVDTGYLKSSLQPGGPENIFDFNSGALTATVGTGVEYSGFQEFGTRRAPAQPFLTPAVEAVRPEFEAAIADLVQRASR